MSARRRGWGHRLAQRWGAPVAALTLGLLARSLRVEFQRREHLEAALASGRPLIAAFWHEHLAAIAIVRQRLQYGDVAVMISRSRDGDLLAAVVRRLGMQPVRASSTRGAVAGLMELKHYLDGPQTGATPPTAAMAPDGPRGPRHEAKPGVALLARRADALIVPVGFGYSRAQVFRSWDRTKLALPFSRLVVRLGPPIDPRQWPGDDQQHAQQLGKLLGKLDRQAGEPFSTVG